MGVCVLGKVPYWNRWWRRRGRFEAAFLFVVFNIDSGGRRLGVPAEARRFLRKRSQVGNEAVWCCMFVRPPLPQAQTGAFGKALSWRMLQRCIVQKEKKKNYCKEFQHLLLFTRPEAMFFFFHPTRSVLKVLYIKGRHTSLILPSRFSISLLLGPKCIQQGSTRVSTCRSGVCACV